MDIRVKACRCPPAVRARHGRHGTGLAGGLGGMVLALCSGCFTPDVQRIEPGTSALTRVGGYVEAESTWRQEKQKARGSGQSLNFRELILRERLKLETEGYLYHPNLLDYSLGGLFGLLQHDFNTNMDTATTGKEDRLGRTLEYDLQADLLKQKTYPASVFARRREDFEPRPFFTSEERSTREYGFQWQYQHETVPTSLKYSTRSVSFDPLSAKEYRRRQENDLLTLDTGYRFSDHNIFSLNYERQGVREEPFDVHYDIDRIRAGHRWSFGAEHQHRLDSELIEYDQRGSLDLERTQWIENLNLRHADTLRSWYRFELAERTHGTSAGEPDIKERSYYLSGTLEHRLFESLVSQGGGYVERQGFETGSDLLRHDLFASFNYRKKNPWGVLNANYGVEYEDVDQGGTAGQIIPVFDEQHTFNDPFPVTLDQQNILLDSIVITDLAGTQVYHLTLDYTLLGFPNRVEIHRVPTGNIADGETVLVDYVYSPGGDFNLGSLNQEFGIRQNFPFGLAPYYRLEWQDQSISDQSTTATVPEDITAHIFGLEYIQDPVTAAAEYQNYNSTLSPFDSYRLSAGYTFHFPFQARGTLGGSWLNVSYHDPNPRETVYFSVDGRYDHTINDHLVFEGNIRYLRDRDSSAGHDAGVDIDLSLSWTYRQTEVRLRYDTARFLSNYTRNESNTIYLQIRRSF